MIEHDEIHSPTLSARVSGRNRGIRGFLVASPVVALAVVSVAACTAVDDDLPAGSEAQSGAAGLRVPEDPGSGCGDAATTDLDNLRPDRVVARCGPGSPEAEPLDDDVTVRVAVDELREDLAPLLLADHLGELAAENLTVELVETDSLREAYEALADDRVDVVAADLHAAFFDMVASGDGARLVLGGAVPSAAGDRDVAQAGLWLADGNAPSAPNRWQAVANGPLAVEDGIYGASAYQLMHVLVQGEVSLNDVNLVPAGGEDAARQLLTGEVVAAWLEDPHWQALGSRPEFQPAVTRPQEAMGGFVLHERLVEPDEDRDVGVAFVRAIIRTINTHLPAGYRRDGEVVAALIETTGWTEDQLQSGSPYVFDWELRAGTVDRMQAAFLPLGAVTFEVPREEDGFLDRSLYEEAVDASPADG